MLEALSIFPPLFWEAQVLVEAVGSFSFQWAQLPPDQLWYGDWICIQGTRRFLEQRNRPYSPSSRRTDATGLWGIQHAPWSMGAGIFLLASLSLLIYLRICWRELIGRGFHILGNKCFK